MNLPAAIRDFFTHSPPDASGLVVAVSGGADSVALLRALVDLQIRPLIVAHLNHQLRGSESDADEQFVGEMCAGLEGVRLAVRRREVARIANERHENLEAAARRERYQFLTDVADEHGAHLIATGHTANDQAETVLHRVLRGTGLQGLRGIAARRELRPGLDVVRPLLRVSRDEVLAYLAERGQSFREDTSNADPRFTRNRIRHELLPLLTANYNPAIVELLGRLAEQAAEQFDDIRRQALELLQSCERPRAGSMCVLDAETLTAAPRNLQREALRQLWQREGWPRDRMGHRDWDRVAAVAAGEIAAVDLPGRIHARRRGRVVQIERR